MCAQQPKHHLQMHNNHMGHSIFFTIYGNVYLQASSAEALNVESVTESGDTRLKSISGERTVTHHSIQQLQTELQRMETSENDGGQVSNRTK